MPITINKLIFDKQIPQKKYEKFDLGIHNPIIPEPMKTNLKNSFLINPKQEFYISDTEMQKAIVSLKSTTDLLNINFNSSYGIQIEFLDMKMDEDEYKIIINSNSILIYANHLHHTQHIAKLVM